MSGSKMRYAYGISQARKRNQGHEPVYHIVNENRPYTDYGVGSYLKALCNAAFLVGPVEGRSLSNFAGLVCMRCSAMVIRKAKEAKNV